MKKRLLMLIVLLFLVAAVIILWFWNSIAKNDQQTIKTKNKQEQLSDQKEIEKNEKTYQDDRHGLSFQYPANWNILEKDNVIYLYQEGKEYSIEDSQVFPISLNLNFENYSGKKTLDEWLKENNNTKLGKKEIQNIKVDGKEAARAKTFLGTETIILADENMNKQVIFSTPNFGDEDINAENLKVYDVVLKSLKFN